MKKFLVIYYSPQGAMEKMKDATPEEMAEGMKPWMDWKEKCGDGMVDMGAPLANGRKVSKDGAEASSVEVSGYSMLQAEDMDGAVEMLKEHPHLEWTEGCRIEVFEAMPLPGSNA